MWERIERLEQPKKEALSLDEVKQQCRIDPDDDDDKLFLERCIKAARQVMEGPEGAGIAVMASPWQVTFDRFPREVRIPMGPVISIDGIKYFDTAGVEQTLAPTSYQWRKGFLEALVKPAFGLSWPSTRDQLNSVTIAFTAGFPKTEDEPEPDLSMVPEALRVAMLMLIAHWYENRETSVVGQIPTDISMGFDAILNQYRVGRIV